jgi:hypothetical protein
VLLLPEPDSERSLTTLGGLSLYHAAGEVGLEDGTEGTLVLVALARLQPALVVDYEDGDAFCPEWLYAFLEEADDVPGCFGVALESGTQRVHNHEPDTVFLAGIEGCGEGFHCRVPKRAHVQQVVGRCV